MSKNLLLTLVLMLSSIVHADFGADWDGGATDSSSTDTSTSSGRVVTPGRSGSSSGRSCKNDSKVTNEINVNKIAPLSFLKKISFNPDGFRVGLTEDKQPSITMPQIASPCIKDLKVHHYTTTKTFFVNFEIDIEGEDKTKSLEENYRACMSKDGNKYFKPNGRLDKNKIYKSGKYKDYVFDDFERNLGKTDYQIAFGYPIGSTFKHENSLDGTQLSQRAPWNCIAYEGLNKPAMQTLLTGRELKAAQHVAKICEDNNVEEMLSFRSDLENSSLRNASRLKDAIDKILKSSVEDQSKKILAELKDLERELKDADDEDSASEIARQYVAKLKMYEKVIINPLTKQVDDLISRRGKVSKDQKKKDEKEMTRLNKIVQKFAKHWGLGAKSGVHKRINKILKKYGLSDEGSQIYDVYLKSKFMANVYKGKKRGGLGKSMTRSKAEKKIVDLSEKYAEKIGDKWQKYYDAVNGDEDALYSQQRDVSNMRDRMTSMSQNFQRTEIETQNKYCANRWGTGPSNPLQCQNFMNGRSMRMRYLQHNLQGMEYSLNGMQRDYASMYTGYNKYQQDQANGDDFNFFNDPYAGVPSGLYSLVGDDMRRRNPSQQNNGAMPMNMLNGMPQQYGSPMQQFGRPMQMGQPWQQQQIPYNYSIR